jgi:DNA invertase Pin-like site-specific DNA recombinase
MILPSIPQTLFLLRSHSAPKSVSVYCSPSRRSDVVVVWKLDRFARSVSHLLRALETFQSLGIEFVSLSEEVDTSTPTGKMVFTVLGTVAELERSLIAERVKAGLRNVRAKGKKFGRPGLSWMPPGLLPCAAAAHLGGLFATKPG